jgi:hypothetical protein
MHMDEYDTVDRPIRLRFRFSEEEADALDDLARANSLTAAALIRTWLHAAINETNNPARNGAPHERTSNANRAPHR